MNSGYLKTYRYTKLGPLPVTHTITHFSGVSPTGKFKITKMDTSQNSISQKPTLRKMRKS